MLAAVATGLLFVLAGWLVRPRPLRDERRATGVVASCERGYVLGDPGWVTTVEFRDVEGRTHRFVPPLNGGRQERVGSPVPVVYSPRDPVGTARRTDGLHASLHRWLVGVGALLILAGLTGVLD